MFSQALKYTAQFVADEHTSAAVAFIGYQGKIAAAEAFGRLCYLDGAAGTQIDSIFDLASLTKVISTTTVTLQLAEQGLLRLDTTIGEILPWAPLDKQPITIEQLLTHSAGMPSAYRLEYHPRFGQRETALEAVFDRPLRSPIGTSVFYACTGFIALALILEKITGTRLDKLFQELVALPLKFKDTGYNPPAEKRNRTACTEWDEKNQSFLRGVVHDERARALDGVSGNAGLFGTAVELAVFCQMLLDEGSYKGKQILQPNTVKLLHNNYSPDPKQPRTLGWVLPGHDCFGGPLLSPKSIGHTGFTGTSLWIDFSRGFYAILLTNRVHPTRHNDAIFPLRPRFYQAVCEAIDNP